MAELSRLQFTYGPYERRPHGFSAQLIYRKPDGDNFRAGWYWLDIRLYATNQRASHPAIYPYYYDESWEQLRIPLKGMHCSSLQRIRGVVLLPYAVDAIGLSLGLAGGCQPRQFVFKPISRLGAASRLLIWSRGRLLGWRSWPVFIKRLISCGLNTRAWISNIYRQHIGMCEETHFDQSETLNSGSLDTKSYADYAPTDKGGPLLSILLPVHNTQAKWLRACIASVLEQSYDNWELCIVDDASDRQETVAFLERVAHADGRIRLLRRNVNGHISKATNTALEAARGGFIVLLDHDDVLHLDALREVAGAITLNPHWDLIYTDEDRINESGRRFFPYFKPDYNPSLLEGQNCISHLGVYRTDIVRRLGGFRVGYEGSQDWDLALRVCDEVGKERVGHIPRVLYHWRVSDISTASDVMAKPYVRSAAKKAIGDHLQRLDQVAEVMEIPWNPGQFRIQYPLRGRASVSLLIPRSSGFEEPASLIALLSNSIDSKLDVEIIFSGSWSMHEVAGLGYSRVKGMQLRHEAGIAEQYNCLARGAAGDVLIFMAAPLVPVDKRCLPELVSQAQRNDIGIAGGKIYDPSGWVRQAYLECTAKGDICDVYRRAPSGSSGQMNRLMLVQDVPLVPLNGAAVRRHLFEEVDGLKPDLPFTISSADFCRRLKARGYRLLFTPFAEFFADNDPAEAGSIHGGEAS